MDCISVLQRAMLHLNTPWTVLVYCREPCFTQTVLVYCREPCFTQIYNVFTKSQFLFLNTKTLSQVYLALYHMYKTSWTQGTVYCIIIRSAYGGFPQRTICPRSSDPFYKVNYYIKCVNTSWTHSIMIFKKWIQISRAFQQVRSGFSCFLNGQSDPDPGPFDPGRI